MRDATTRIVAAQEIALRTIHPPFLDGHEIARPYFELGIAYCSPIYFDAYCGEVRVEESLYLLAGSSSDKRTISGTTKPFRGYRCARHTLDAIHWFDAGFEVSAHQKLADKAHREQLHTEQAEHH